jgi:hypothetical protein
MLQQQRANIHGIRFHFWADQGSDMSHNAFRTNFGVSMNIYGIRSFPVLMSQGQNVSVDVFVWVKMSLGRFVGGPFVKASFKLEPAFLCI